MATAEQIKALIRSYLSDNSEQFLTVALQMAAHEAKQGHSNLAQEIRELEVTDRDGAILSHF